MRKIPLLLISLSLLAEFIAVPLWAIEMRSGFHREDKPQQFTFLVRYLPSSRHLWISEADINTLPNKDKILTLRVSAFKKSDGAILFKKDFQFDDKKRLENLEIEQVDFSGDTFWIKGELPSRQGAEGYKRRTAGQG